MSKARHHRADGGEVEPKLKDEKVYEGEGSNVEKEADEGKAKGGRAKGKKMFKDGGHVEGEMAAKRHDRPGRKRGGRAGADMSPLTTASHVTDAKDHKATEGDALEGP